MLCLILCLLKRLGTDGYLIRKCDENITTFVKVLFQSVLITILTRKYKITITQRNANIAEVNYYVGINLLNLCHGCNYHVFFAHNRLVIFV